jgi:hypothetical protein
MAPTRARVRRPVGPNAGRVARFKTQASHAPLTPAAPAGGESRSKDKAAHPEREVEPCCRTNERWEPPASYQKYYNEVRTHPSLQKDAPVRRDVCRTGRVCSSPMQQHRAPARRNVPSASTLPANAGGTTKLMVPLNPQQQPIIRMSKGVDRESVSVSRG